MPLKGISEQKLNLTLALCAVLISIASFYATYLQANAAEKQVKAMTLPLLQYETGNVDAQSYQPVIAFTINNNGVGPALIKTINYQYNGKSSSNFFDFLKDCCFEEVKEFESRSNKTLDLSLGGYVTSSTENVILSTQGQLDFYKLYKGEVSEALWQKLNIERGNLSLELCYCSLLEDCYTTKGRGSIQQVSECPTQE
jgi:hypothetical protein